MSKRIALGGHRSGETRSNSIAGISKAVAANAGSFGRSAAVVAAASGMVLTLGVPAQANPAAREAAAAPMDALNIERVALQSSVVATVVAPTADSKKAETAQVRATLKTAPAPAKAKAEPKTVTASVKAAENANEAATTEAPAAQNTVSAAETRAAAEARAAEKREAAQKSAAEKREAAQKSAAEKREAAQKRAAEKRAAAAKKQREAAERRASASTNAFAPVTRSNRTGATSTSTKSVAPASSSVNTASLSGIAATASRYSGVPYVWGGASPSGWDCSGFVQWVYKQHGINLVRGTSALRSSGQFVRTGNPKPGDLVFQNGGGHVGIYLGNGMMIGAQNPTVDTMIHSVSRNPLYGYYTYVG
ncbi:C40 family peptidase [Neomicrococcus lactis]|uniref:C40 family peptidase n=1 Tax=Neomicrococcus lactis TaxID=732241 RepID=UPI0023011D18|nr:C40 family peptidase [Neomicrococcus lactis]